MKVHQVGAGGVGFWLTPSLLRAGHEVTVYDDDTFQGGLGHMRLPKVSNPATKKVDFARGFCLAVMGDKGITVSPYKFRGDEVEVGDLVVDCSDMPLTVRRGVWERARELGARCLRISYDGRNSTVVVAEDLPLKGRPEGGYANVPDLALSFMAGGIGALAVQKILSGWTHHIDFQISLDTFFVNWDETLTTTTEKEVADDSQTGQPVQGQRVQAADSEGLSPYEKVERGNPDAAGDNSKSRRRRSR